jgi:DNA-3-methyladenine glycosylase (3mg)
VPDLSQAIAFDREFFDAPATAVAPKLLGALLTHETDEGMVTVRLTEVEAYLGDGTDPGSHAFSGRTKRNAVMFGQPAHLYAYFTYGMHVCGNVACSPPGEASGVLMRGGEVVDGIELARSRRPTAKRDVDLARGPARLALAVGIRLADNGADLLGGAFRLTPEPEPHAVASGPRTGVSGPGGSARFSWRYWIPSDPTVSPYKRHRAAHD